MKIKIFDNEATLLITGDIMMAAGGVVLGLLIELTQIRYELVPVCIAFFGLGGYFDYKSILTFSSKLVQLKDEIKKSKEQLDATIKHAKEIEGKLEESQRRLKTAEEKVFGSSGATFSHASWARPIEKEVEELKRRLRELESKLHSMDSRRFGHPHY